MPDPTTPAPPPLVDIHNVELIHVGSWPASTGQWDVTLDDLHQAVAALDCPSVRKPIIKIGHTDPRFDGEPAIGWIDNLHVEADQILVGDYRGLPGWLAAKDPAGNSVLASAWPDRSIEGEYSHRCQLGHTHPFVLTAVALLGVASPAVGPLESLNDVASLFGVEAAAGEGQLVRATIRAQQDDNDPDDEADPDEPEHTGAMIALIPTTADAERLAVIDGEPVEQLHTTLYYLGEGADFSDPAREHLTELVRSYLDADGGLGVVEAGGFGLSLFNPHGDEPAIVLDVDGEQLAEAHNRILAAIEDYGADLPEQHKPWRPHITLTYDNDSSTLGALVDRCGPVTFDRVRMAFADQYTDLPLTQAATVAGRSTMPKPPAVAAAVSTEDVRRGYYEQADWSKWITEIHLDPLQLIVVDDDTGKHFRVPVAVSGEDDFAFGAPVEVAVRYVDVTTTEPVAATRATVYATRAESRPDQTPAATADPQPAAEPEPTTQEDDMPLSEIRSRLGLSDDADEQAVFAAIDDLRQAATPAEPVAATVDVDERVKAATTQWREEAQRLSEQLAEVRAAQAKDVERRAADDKRAFFDGITATGRLKPAERAEWEGRYDRAPEVTREILSARAAGSEVPVAPVGQSGSTESAGDEDSEFDHLFAPTGASK